MCEAIILVPSLRYLNICVPGPLFAAPLLVLILIYTERAAWQVLYFCFKSVAFLDLFSVSLSSYTSSFFVSLQKQFRLEYLQGQWKSTTKIPAFPYHSYNQDESGAAANHAVI